MRAVTALLVAGLIAGPTLAEAKDQCARPVEKSAFDVAGLKSQLMVTAISCKVEEKYNAFILRFRPDLVAQEKSLASYFARSYGRRAQQERDDYITSLANTQSQNGIKAGSFFCRDNVGLFDEVMKLPTGKELPTYASSKTLVQPIVLVSCPAPAPKVTRTASTQAAKKTPAP